jgi:ribonuclease D
MDPVAEILVADPDELDRCCAKLAACTRLGLDTEFVGEHSYHPELCLVQVATEDALYLIDPFAVGSLDAFWHIVTSPTHLVVVHAGREEVRLCHRAFGQVPARLFDLQIAVGLVGMPYPLSHAALASHVLGKRLSKSETLTEWRSRPLTPSQIHYAFDDVRYLLAMHDRVHKRLEELGRSAWAEEEFRQLTEVATPADATEDTIGERWRKVRGTGSLDRRRLAVLRELYLWREQQAQKLNRPARTIVRDDLLVEIARRHAKSPRDLKVIRGLAHRHLDELYQAMDRARSLPPEQLPHLAEREQDAPQVALAAGILQAVLVDFAAKNKLAQNLVATTQDVKNLARARLQGESPPDAPLTRGWRAEFVLPHLQAVLEGRRAVRIADLRREAPLDYVEFTALANEVRTAEPS